MKLRDDETLVAMVAHEVFSTAARGTSAKETAMRILDAIDRRTPAAPPEAQPGDIVPIPRGQEYRLTREQFKAFLINGGIAREAAEEMMRQQDAAATPGTAPTPVSGWACDACRDVGCGLCPPTAPTTAPVTTEHMPTKEQLTGAVRFIMGPGGDEETRVCTCFSYPHLSCCGSDCTAATDAAGTAPASPSEPANAYALKITFSCREFCAYCGRAASLPVPTSPCACLCHVAGTPRGDE